VSRYCLCSTVYLVSYLDTSVFGMDAFHCQIRLCTRRLNLSSASFLFLLSYSIFRFYGTRLIFLTFGFISAKLTDLPGRTCQEDLFYSQLVVKLNSVIVFTYS